MVLAEARTKFRRSKFIFDRFRSCAICSFALTHDYSVLLTGETAGNKNLAGKLASAYQQWQVQ
jgi:hypothetical protein